MLYEKLQSLMEEKGYNNYSLEKECGFGNGTISKWKESSPSVLKMKQVADKLEVDINYFLEN